MIIASEREGKVQQEPASETDGIEPSLAKRSKESDMIERA